MIDNDGQPLRIGVDGYNLALPQGTGVATYGRTLVDAIRGGGGMVDLIYGIPVSPKAPVKLRETLFYGRLSEEESGARRWPRSFRQKMQRWLVMPFAQSMIEIVTTGQVMTSELEHRVPVSDRLFTRGYVYDIAARYFRRYRQFLPIRIPNPPAIMHWTYPIPMRLVGSLNIYTIHDLVPLRLPHASLEDKRYYERLIRTCIEDGDHIVTVSEASRRDILEIFFADPSTVTNSYQPVEQQDVKASFDRTRNALWLRRLFDLEQDEYILFFGAIEPKKNVGRLIEAYLASGIERPLLIVGGDGWKCEHELRLLRGAHGTILSGAARIRRIDYLPRSMLVEVVRGARMVVFPSLYEGFGLPALEAMALGVPVITSETGSLPEIAGDAALTVDPYDVEAIKTAMCRLDADDGLRKAMSAAGPEQAARFAMPAYRITMETLYKDVLSGSLRSGRRVSR